MYLLLLLAVALALVLWLSWFLSWTVAEAPEDSAASEEQRRNRRNFYDPRTWAAYQRWTRHRPLLISYRRDKRGRFRKLR